MRIAPRTDIRSRRKHVVREIRRAYGLGPVPEPVCSGRCPDYRPSIGCHRDCGAARQRLSSEGDGSPVETLVAPLVFELKRLGVFHPCWSCEGHDDGAGNSWKLPQVWFYSDSVVHVRALAEAVDRLFHAGRLAARWHVILTYSDPDNPDTTFSLEPEMTSDVRLGALQGDLRIMADTLAPMFRTVCETLAGAC